MRFLVTVTFPVETANQRIKDGSFGQKLRAILAELKPEAAYFVENDGCRTGFLVVNMQEASQIPSIAEPFFLNFNAQVRIRPAMTPEDLAKAGLDDLAKKWG